ncbi:MAG: tRNA (adenosine(37)-N6)-dimethylallyltransferase MiaA [Dehalococcoidales bacterium]|nr:tRNA (adenosine(37)-N6)-dimethylallyltransferase MiaA [Dehalococcoidales bacterium]
MNRLVAIVGPTGAGKSQLALRLVQQFDGEIVGADSRQVYRQMDIGTAKPNPKEQALVPHHLIDVVNPDEDFSLAQYQQLAYRAIEDIQNRNKLALLVGGTGLYVWAILEGWVIPQVPPDMDFRKSLNEKADRNGIEDLYRELTKVDPSAAQKIDPRNVRRVIRALEVHRHKETPFSQLQQKKAPSFNTLTIGLTADRTELYRRVDARVDGMIEQGLVEEVKKLIKKGYTFNLPAMSGIGYKQIGMFLRGESTLKSAIEQIKFETHRFIRHQYNWFRLTDKRIHWFDVQGEIEAEIRAKVAGFISS